MTLPTNSAARKDIPLARGCLDYFPDALCEVARLSKVGNDKHNPGEEMHHARRKSTDHADCIMRHLAERGTLDDDGVLHEVKVAWRALALAQEAVEARGAPMARGACPPGAGRVPIVVEDEGVRVVPVVTRIEYLRAGECPNDVADRVAGDTARHIRAVYYNDALKVGDSVRDVDDGWRGVLAEVNDPHGKVRWLYTGRGKEVLGGPFHTNKLLTSLEHDTEANEVSSSHN